jgi:hypothetical protein
MKRFAAVLGQILLGAAIFLVLLEIGVRVVRPEGLLMKGKESFFPGDPDTQFAIRPNARTELGRKDFRISVESNALGFRDVDRPPKGKALRALALGDSFTFGWGVPREETFEARMEALQAARARAAGERPIEVINAGVPGYTLYQSLLALEKRGWRVDPDVVIAGVFVQNDFSENSVTRDWLERKRRGLTGKHDDDGIAEWLAAHSQAYVWLRVKYKSSYRLQRSWYKLTRPFSRKDETYRHRNLMVFRKPSPPEMEAEWKLSERILRDLRDTVSARGRKLLVVLIPSELQVVRAQWEQEVRHEKMSPATFDLDSPNRRALAICRDAGIPALDLLPPLRAASDGGAILYLPSDHHWNARGHALAADLILRKLREEGWLDRAPGGA